MGRMLGSKGLSCLIGEVKAYVAEHGVPGPAGSGVVNWEDINGRPDLSNLGEMMVLPFVLSSSAWDSSNRQPVIAIGILEDEVEQLIVPVPTTSSESAYRAAGIRCVSQGVDSLTFQAKTAPTEDIHVNVYVFEAAEVKQEFSGNFVWWSPAMTSENTPEPYVVSAGGYDDRPTMGGGQPWKAWDADSSTGWLYQNARENLWNAIDLGAERVIKGIAIFPTQKYTYFPASFDLYRSSNNVDWELVQNVSGFTGSAELQKVEFDDYFTARYVKIANVQEQPALTNGFAGINEIWLYIMEQPGMGGVIEE